jgi:hypothetical protein
MGLLDGILGQLGGGNIDVASIAQQVGLDPAMAEKAIAALGQAHPAPGDTVAAASQQTAIDSATLNQIVGHLGGEGALGQVAGALQNNPQILSGIGGMLDRDGDGNPINDILGMASDLFGKK